jgi:hypothetical protein
MTHPDPDSPLGAPEAAKASGFWRSRWRSEAPLRTLLWRDMLAVGTVINLLLGFAALMLAAKGSDMRTVLGVHLSAVPYNLFLARAVWRSAQARAWHRTTAVVWVAVMVAL